MFQNTDPIKLFSEWFKEAKNHPNIIDATAMSLATGTKDGKVSVRIVLLKSLEDPACFHLNSGFPFYTNLTSRKSVELQENPYVALCFHWAAIKKQIRIEGKIEKISDEEADLYFSSRARESQISSWSSHQSARLASYDDFLVEIEKTANRFKDRPVPRPDFWSGFKVIPSKIEFWIDHDFRRHERFLFTKEEQNWSCSLLYP